jgi:hypothetical protein
MLLLKAAETRAVSIAAQAEMRLKRFNRLLRKRKAHRHRLLSVRKCSSVKYTHFPLPLLSLLRDPVLTMSDALATQPGDTQMDWSFNISKTMAELIGITELWQIQAISGPGNKGTKQRESPSPGQEPNPGQA